HGSRGLRVVGILCDHRVDRAREFLASKGYGWPQLVDRTLPEGNDLHPIAARYAIAAFPQVWLVDRAGVLREKGEIGRLAEQVKRLLDEPPPSRDAEKH